MSLINTVATQGIENWLDDQLQVPASQTQAYIDAEVRPFILPYEGQEEPEIRLDDINYFHWAWWHAAMNGADLVRQRVAMALSEIMVVSTNVDLLSINPLGMANWYDMLLQHAFGNFRALLYDVTMHPIMGHFLSHVRNRKSDSATNRFPDENYAREVMQLFTIGLYELNLDGSQKLDGDNNPIPTYNNDHITEFAKIFTGLTYHHTFDPNEEYEDVFLYTAEILDQPMVMYESMHEPGPKNLLNGAVIPAGQSGMEDINDAVDHLFNHPNVGPFIARRLIQRLVKSNPSPAYIERVATAFNDNGSGIRGDMQAIIKAILLDDEARNLSYISEPGHGMLREPFVRYTQLCRVFSLTSTTGKYWHWAYFLKERLGQMPFEPPSVFNFFSPDYQPLGPLGDAGIPAPEFQITNSYTAISTINLIHLATVWNYPLAGYDADHVNAPMAEFSFDFSPELALVDDDDALIDHLDMLLTYGTLSTETRQIIKDNLAATPDWVEPPEKVSMAVHLFMVSPEYAILK